MKGIWARAIDLARADFALAIVFVSERRRKCYIIGASGEILVGRVEKRLLAAQAVAP